MGIVDENELNYPTSYFGVYTYIYNKLYFTRQELFKILN